MRRVKNKVNDTIKRNRVISIILNNNKVIKKDRSAK